VSATTAATPSLWARIGWPNIVFLLFLTGCLAIVLISGAGQGMRYSVVGGMSFWVAGAAAYMLAGLVALVVSWPLSLALVRVVDAMHYGW